MSLKNNLQNALYKSLPAVSTLVRDLSNYCDHFLRHLGFSDLFNKVILVKFKFS